MLIQKFGGTSVGSAQRIKDLTKLVVNSTPKIVVLSAMSGTTNALVEINNALYTKNTVLANELISKLNLNGDLGAGPETTLPSSSTKEIPGNRMIASCSRQILYLFGLCRGLYCTKQKESKQHFWHLFYRL